MERDGLNKRISGIIEGTGAGLMMHSVTHGGVEGLVDDEEDSCDNNPPFFAGCRCSVGVDRIVG